MSDSVATLIAGPGFDAAWEDLLRVARDALGRHGATAVAADWLSAGRACDLAFASLAPERAAALLRTAIENALGILPLDIVAQPGAGRRKRLLVADLEATIIANEMLDELADLRGLGPRIAEITRRAMNGEIEFAAALAERVALLRGTPIAALADVARRIRINPGARELVATMRAHGAYTALISGGFRTFSALVRHALGFDIDVANELVFDGGVLAGTVRAPILDRDGKRATLERLAAERGLSLGDTLAVGDGANDLPMIERAGLGVAYHGKPALADRAPHRIDRADLRALLYVQGYRDSEIAAAA
jgi:phosphoserine phosphatase